jgi:hypothetical protein
MKKQIAITLIVFAATVARAQHDHTANSSTPQPKNSVSFNDEKMNYAYDQYLKLKDALVLSKADDAKKAAGELQKSLAKVANGNLAASEAGKIALVSDLPSQRGAFSALSNEMSTLAKAAKITKGSLFIEYCPMANNNHGAFWLSNEKEIKNPYFGDMMLRCGSVKETLE